jgi:hypothetical protein
VAKNKQSAEEVRSELRELTKGSGPVAPPNLNQAYLRVGLVVVALWIAAGAVASFVKASWPLAIAAVLTLVLAGLGIWVLRMTKKQQALGALLQGADTADGRKEALRKLATDFKGNDAQALFARAQLEAQDDPTTALATLEKIDVGAQMAPFAAQVRATKAMLMLQLGDAKAARMEVDKLELDKQQDPKVRAMFAAVASEAWARTGQSAKALTTLELFSTEDADLGEIRLQLLRARAFAYAAEMDTKGVNRTLKKLMDLNPHLLSMFVGQKRVHPLLEQQAKQLVMQSGVVQRKQVRQ